MSEITISKAKQTIRETAEIVRVACATAVVAQFLG